jgi:hypothetical protein
LPQNKNSSNQLINQTVDQYDNVTAGRFFQKLVVLQGIEGSCYQVVATAEDSFGRKVLEVSREDKNNEFRIKLPWCIVYN